LLTSAETPEAVRTIAPAIAVRGDDMRYPTKAAMLLVVPVTAVIVSIEKIT